MGRSKQIKEMDLLASENYIYKATREEIDVHRGNWWIRSNVVNFDTMPTRHQPDFMKALIERGTPVSLWLTIHFRCESQQKLNSKFKTCNISVTAVGSLLSPGRCEYNTSCTWKFTNIFMIHKATEHCVYLHAQSQQSWDLCDQLHERHDTHRRVHCAVLSTLRTVFRCVDLMRSYVT